MVCGSNGLLGQKLAWLFNGKSDYEVLHTSHHRSFVQTNTLVDYTQLDVSNRSDVKSLVSSFRPDVILNAAAIANVDLCETEREQAWKVNVTAVENLVEVCRRIGAKLVHISTDYVFDGKTGNYTEEDRAHPINYYGKTKLAGENIIISGGIEHAILRTILIYGGGINVKNNFGLWLVNNLNRRQHIQCVDDQISNPTHVYDIAFAMQSVIDQNISGLFHVCGAETVSRYNFALKTAEIFGFDSSLIKPSKTSEIQRPAQRPLNTSFIFEKAKKAFRYHPMNITEGLKLFQQEITGINLN
jgi:dTDP-4-dehydrorhamnose reductase